MNNDNNLPARKFIRLKGYDYRWPGAYFITICTAGKKHYFGSIKDGRVSLSQVGLIVEKCWLTLPKSFHNVRLDTYVIMPNHIHGIIILVDDEEHCRGEAFANQLSAVHSIIAANASPDPHFAIGTLSGSISAIIQSFKANTSRRINAVNGTRGGTLWQRNYYEHIIRSEQSLDEIREYTLGNPWNWSSDRYF